jgi:AcrR family transcriptional regulator
VTLGLTTQRELDAAVAKAAKAAGVAAPTDTRFEGDRAALIEQLREERERHVREAEAALAGAGEEALRDEVVPGIRDPFKNTPTG